MIFKGINCNINSIEYKEGYESKGDLLFINANGEIFYKLEKIGIIRKKSFLKKIIQFLDNLLKI